MDRGLDGEDRVVAHPISARHQHQRPAMMILERMLLTSASILTRRRGGRATAVDAREKVLDAGAE